MIDPLSDLGERKALKVEFDGLNPVAQGGPTIVEVRLVIKEKEIEVAPGARISRSRARLPG